MPTDSVSVGLAHKFCLAWLRAGGTVDELNKLAEDPAAMRGVVAGIRGQQSAVATSFPTWRTITLGARSAASNYARALESAGYKIGNWARDILRKTPIATIEIEIELVRVTPAELGFIRAARYDEICQAAFARGLELCPAEVGPALRLSYSAQPRGEWPVIAMEAITGSSDDLSVFFVVHDGDGRWLITCDGDADYEWYPGNQFVFARRK